MPLAPIALFVYNRPLHTRNVLQSLKANPESASSLLVVFCDGPSPASNVSEREKINAVRALVRSESWCKEVRVIEQDINSGLAASIVRGVTRLTEEFGKVIVLEDDLLLSPGFLAYMNQALELYESNDQVMHISGYMYPRIRLPLATHPPDTFFSEHMACWGWGTWKRAWDHYSGSANDLLRRLEESGSTTRFNMDSPTGNFLDQLQANVNGTLHTWAIKWGASIFLQKGLCLFPGNTLVKNVGTDGTGTHRDVAEIFLHQKLFKSATVTPIAVKEDQRQREVLKWFFRFLLRPKTLIDKVLEKSMLLS